MPASDGGGIVGALIDDVLWGLRWATAYLAVYLAWALLVLITGGEAAFARHGVTAAQTVALYVATALGAGIIVGVLRQAITSTARAALVGVLAAAPLGLFGAWMGFGMEAWTFKHSIVLAWISIAGGSAAGAITYTIHKE
jgi:hypothetical protein